jgi:hypothetical protein
MGDYREVAILTGGFVPLMYRRMPGFLEPPMPPPFTSDFDWTVPVPLEVLGGRALAERLLDSKFVTIPSAGTEPPVLRFQPERFGTTMLGPTYVEFLAPLVERLRARFPAAWFDRVHDLIDQQFESEAADGPIAVVRQYRDLPGRAPSERAVWQTVRDFARTTGIV